MSWTQSNLATQGYCLSSPDAHSLRIGLRFPTALCLVLVVVALALESALIVALLVPVGAIAGWTQRHPFDYIYFCIPSTTLAWLDGRARKEVIA